MVLSAVPSFHRFHLAVFYLYGSFRQIAYRIAGVRYISASERPNRNFSYLPLGALLLAQLIGEMVGRHARWRKELGDETRAIGAASEKVTKMSRNPNDITMPSILKRGKEPVCRICMCNCDCPTATPCGHLFCWECIAPWVATKPSCPLCRAAALPRQLLPVCHYAPA